jgi:hypothetical protein
MYENPYDSVSNKENNDIKERNFNKPEFVPQSFGQEIIDSFDRSCQLNLDGVHFLSIGAFQLNVLLVKMDIIYNSVH